MAGGCLKYDAESDTELTKELLNLQTAQTHLLSVQIEASTIRTHDEGVTEIYLIFVAFHSLTGTIALQEFI